MGKLSVLVHLELGISAEARSPVLTYLPISYQSEANAPLTRRLGSQGRVAALQSGVSSLDLNPPAGSGRLMHLRLAPPALAPGAI